jgi:hypothetical protein
MPVNGVRIATDGERRPHVVYTAGGTSQAKRSSYTARIESRWIPAEKFADAADRPIISRRRAAPRHAFDAATGHAFVAVVDAKTKLAVFTVHRPQPGWGRKLHADPAGAFHPAGHIVSGTLDRRHLAAEDADYPLTR